MDVSSVGLNAAPDRKGCAINHSDGPFAACIGVHTVDEAA
jgi:hypothetical protein